MRRTSVTGEPDAAPARVSVGGSGAPPASVRGSGDLPAPTPAVVGPGDTMPLAAPSDTRGTAGACAPAEPLVVGARVELVGLGTAHLNGIVATVAGPLNDRCRWTVTTDEGRVLAIKPANLRVVAGAAAATAAPETVDGVPETPTTTAAEPVAAAAATTATAKTCSWAACGNELSGEAAAKNRCGRCKRVYYCSRRCQKKDWKEGGHKLVCDEAPCCNICLEGGDEPLPMQRGCGCRGDAGLAHVACVCEAASHQALDPVGGYYHGGWTHCPTCGQMYSGDMELGLARDLVYRRRHLPRHAEARVYAAHNLGSSLIHRGEFAEAQVLLEEAHTMAVQIYGADEVETLNTASALAETFRFLKMYTKAEALLRSVVEACERTLGKEHHTTLATTSQFAQMLAETGRDREAEPLLRKMQSKMQLFGCSSLHIMTNATFFGDVLAKLDKCEEAEVVFTQTLAAQRRVLGDNHPLTKRTSQFLNMLLKCK